MSSGDDNGERNPFAPPPADAPDQPWQPRSPKPGEGQGGAGGQGGERPQLPPPWGSGQGDGHPGQRPPAPQPPRLDPADPAHRRARNAALAGPFALVCLFAGFHWIALLVGALGIVWGIGALRAPRPARTAATAAAGHAPGAPAPNPLTPAALAGILTGAMTVVVATAVIGLGYHYREYVTCVQDSLTSVGAENCDRYAPQWYVDFTGNTE
ncbi:hypothetical protein [Streptomyces sp. NRRL S-350]|uniref:hypothetical protein n=1 Tax=Streptomyces sp. NRRL S-350 TaxID=1463902 RepID=UPI00068D76D3|nr:hypothetical protein [Streptomyces sp. NRRL S-350]